MPRPFRVKSSAKNQELVKVSTSNVGPGFHVRQKQYKILPLAHLGAVTESGTMVACYWLSDVTIGAFPFWPEYTSR
jgi:hypothetical protein